MMDTILETIQEWVNEGYEYLYQESPDRMKELETYLLKQNSQISILYRRTDWPPMLNAKSGDLVEMNRISSWSQSSRMPDQKYEGIPSVMLILRQSQIRGSDVSEFSPFKNEREFLLAPCHLFVEAKNGDILEVRYVDRYVKDDNP